MKKMKIALVSGVLALLSLMVVSMTVVKEMSLETYEASFTDTSSIVEFENNQAPVSTPATKVGLPKVETVTIDRKKLMSEARIKYMRNRRAEAKKFVESWKGLGRPTALVVNLSSFAGSEDKVVKEKEEGSVIRTNLRSVKTKNVRGMAWFMPEFSEENPESPIKVPSVETWLGGGAKTLKQRIENANKALADYDVEVTSLDESGRIIAGPIRVALYDRGPNTRFKNPRADAFEKTWSDLGVLDSTVNPNSDDHLVNLVVRLVPKQNIEEDVRFAMTENADADEKNRKYYGPQDAEHALEEVLVESLTPNMNKEGVKPSKKMSLKVKLPSWDENPEITTVASNP